MRTGTWVDLVAHFACICCLVVSTAAGAVHAGTVVVRGVVRAVAGEAVPGAVVWVQGMDGALVQADARGEYRLELAVDGVSKGLSIYAGAPGYSPSGFVVDLDPDRGKAVSLDFTIAPKRREPPSAMGRGRPGDGETSVKAGKGHGGRSEAGADIHRTSRSPGARNDSGLPAYVEIVSDGPAGGLPEPVSYGKPVSSVPPGYRGKPVRIIRGRMVVVDERPAGAAAEPKSASPAATGGGRSVKPPPQRHAGPPLPFTIEGNVRNRRGRPVGGALVFLAGDSHMAARTDRRGRFTLKLLFPNQRRRVGRTLVIQHPNFMERRLNLRFNPYETEGMRLSDVTLYRYRGLLRRRRRH